MGSGVNNYLHDVVGKVIELHLPYKAIVAFQSLGKQERALLRADKLILDGENVPMGVSIDTHLHEGSIVRFSCHTFDQSGQDHCGYFITMAWHVDPNDRSNAGSASSSVVLSLYYASGIVADVSNRQGVILYTDPNGREHSVLFMASKLFLFGKRLNTKQSLQSTLAIDDKVQFDAVPCEASENDNSCPWFATLVWKGKKPNMDYDSPTPMFTEPQNLMTDIKHLTSNPKSTFVRGDGQILQILNKEYGVALACIKPNIWESVLFHRSVCFLFKLNLASHDLTDIFKEGDKIRFIAAKAPKHLITQWVASQITVYSNDMDYGF